MNITEHDLSELTPEEFTALFEKARDRCQSDDLKTIFLEMSKLLRESKRLSSNN